jgi:hypothetical protein
MVVPVLFAGKTALPAKRHSEYVYRPVCSTSGRLKSKNHSNLNDSFEPSDALLTAVSNIVDVCQQFC